MIYPIKEFTLEVCSSCNFHCTFCPYDDIKRDCGSMDIELAKRLVDEIADKKLARAFGVEIMGEPMMYKHLAELLDHVKSRGLYMWFTTNGSFLSEKNISMLLNGPLETLAISFQTPDAESFKQRGTTMDFEKYRAGVENLVRQRLHSESEVELMVLVMCTMHNLLKKPRVMDSFSEVKNEVMKWAKLASDEGAKVDFEELNNALKRYRKNASTSTMETNIPITKGFSVRVCLSQRWGPWIMDAHNIRVTPSETGHCSNPFNQFHVLWNGKVTYCCFDYNGELAVADMNKMSIEEALNGPIAEIKEKFRKGNLPSDFCKRCRGQINKIDLIKAMDFSAAARLVSDPSMLRLFVKRLVKADMLSAKKKK